MSDIIFQYFPISIFVWILLGLIIRFLLIELSLTNLINSLLYGIGIGSLILMPGKHEHDYSIEKHMTFLPFAWIVGIVFVMVIKLWDTLRKPIHEGVFTINMIALLYGAIELSRIAEYSTTVVILLPILIFILLWALYNNFTNNRLSDANQFIIVLINTLLISILGGIYSTNMISMLFHEPANIGFLNAHTWNYLLFGFNILFIAQQFGMLSMLFPQKHTPYDIVFERAFKEYDRNYTTKIQTQIGNYGLLILGILLACGINFFIHLIQSVYFVGLLISLGSIFEIKSIQSKLFTQLSENISQIKSKFLFK